MNVYILVEGKRTEKKIYPKWLSILAPDLIKINYVEEALSNNYYLISGEGFPSLLHHLENAINEVNELNKYDYLVVCLDTEETSCEERNIEIKDYLSKRNIILKSAELVIIAQNPCFETWFLGNRKMFKRNPQNSTLCDYIKYYNIQTNDPELMSAYDAGNTKAQFHASYLREIFRERNIVYTKKNPGDVGEDFFLRELINRNLETGHIPSFKVFLDFCRKINL